MQIAQVLGVLAAAAACASAFPGGLGGLGGLGGTSHVSQSAGYSGGLGGGFGGGHGGDFAGGLEGYGGHEAHHFPEYKYEYAVHDPHTGDVKSQSESRHGDAVKGSYSIADADGSLRTVEYTADKHTGFQAIVKKGGKVTVHGYGKQDEQNNAVAGIHAPQAAAGGYSNTVSHGVSFGAGGKAVGGGLEGGFGGDHIATFAGH